MAFAPAVIGGVVNAASAAAPILGGVATVAQLGLSGAQAYSSIKAGQAQAKALEQRARALELQGKYVDIQSDQAAGNAREELRTTLDTITAIRAARGGMATAGGQIAAEVSRRARRGERIQLLGLSAQKTAILNEIQAMRDSQGAARTSGVIGAIPGLIDATGAAARLAGARG